MNTNDNKEPFYNPWGGWGYIWRMFLFLLGIVLLVFLFSLIKSCDKNQDDEDPDPYKDVRDTSKVHDWNDTIPNVHELPIPDSNFVPPIDTTSIIPSPDDSLVSIIAGQLIVFFNSSDVVADISSFARQFKNIYPDKTYKIEYYNVKAGSMLLAVPQDRIILVMDELHQKIQGIDFYVATNDVLGECKMPSDADFANANYDEYFRLIQAYEAWDITQGVDSVTVAIVDSYFDLTNPEIGERYSNPINIPTKTANVYPPARRPRNENALAVYCHGSHVAGCAIGGQNNGKGCSGIAPNCKWIPISICDPKSNVMTTFASLEGIMYAIYRGADVINCSFGAAFPEGVDQAPLQYQVDYATQSNKRGEALLEFIYKTADSHNAVIVKAAGNDNILMGCDPANRSKMIINVEAVDGKGEKAYQIDQNGQKHYFSNWDKVPEVGIDYQALAAPGVRIWSVTDKRCVPIWQQIGYKASPDGFQEMDGTSMASPIVAGAVALLKSKNKNLSTEQIKKILLMTAKQTDRNPNHRIGPVIQIKDALDATPPGQVANFDDLMKNHDLLIGKWKSTHELALFSDDVQTDEVWVYFVFDTSLSGNIEIHTIASQRLYYAGLTVQWGAKKINITQLSDAVSSGGETISKDSFVCTPDKDGLLKVKAMKSDGSTYEFMLEKVN